VLECLLTNSFAKVDSLEQTGRQAVSVVQKAVPLLAKNTQKAAAARDQWGTKQRIGRDRAAVADLMTACEGLLAELSHLFALQGRRQTPAGQNARSHVRRVQSLLKDLAGARQQYDDVFHVTKMANRFMLIREPNDSPHADARRDLESQGNMDPRNLSSVLRSVLGARNVMTDTWAALHTLAAAGVTEESASWPLLRGLDIISAADVLATLQAGGRPSMSDAPADSTVGSDANDVPQASPSLTRAWWRSPSPSKRRQSSLRTGSGGGGFCMSGRNLSATLDDAVEVVKAADGGASSASTPAAAVDPEALQTLEAPPIQVKAMPKGGRYRGGIVDGEKCGLGQFEYRNGDRYEGQFAEDQYNGFGVYTFANGGLYQGQWADNKYEGLGVETFATGGTYHGGYQEGQRHGWGACSFANGDYYEGQWEGGARHGRGMQQCPNHSSYVGDYKNGKRDGYGCFTWGSGDRYIGEFSCDRPHGVGVYLFQSGQMYEGQWREGSKHGWSIFSLHNGQQWAGRWAEGRPQWMQNTASADTAPSGSTAGTAADVQKAVAAAAQARSAGTEGAARFSQHWEPEGELQGSVRRTVHQAVAAAEASASLQEAALRAVSAAVKAMDAAAAAKNKKK